MRSIAAASSTRPEPARAPGGCPVGEGGAAPKTVAVAAGYATVLLLSTATAKVQRFVDVFIGVYTLMIFAYVLSSWIRPGYSPVYNRIQQFLRDTCEPYLGLFRRFIPALGPLDVSPIVAVIVLAAIDRILAQVL